MTAALRKHRLRRCLIILALAWSGTAMADATAVRTLGKLPRLADRGQFDLVLDLLKSDSDLTRDPDVASLVEDLEQRERHEQDRRSQQLEAYQAAVDQMAQLTTEHKINDALLSAIEAHGLAPDPEHMLEDPSVGALVTHAQTAADKAAAAGQWLEALSLYRGLEFLFNDDSRYRNRSRDLARRVRLLRFYAPEEFMRLYEERNKAPADQPRDPVKISHETWQQKLHGIDRVMLRQTLRHAALKHVSNNGFRPLLLGAIDAMLVLLDTPDLSDTFPTLGDPDKRGNFRNYLVTLRRTVDSGTNDLKFIDAERLIDRIMKFNEQTVDLPEPVMVFELTDGALETLDDFTAVIWPREKVHFSRNTQGKFYGVGIQIARRNARLIVISPLLNTPAQQAGIKAADIIAEVNYQDTSTWTLNEAVRNITGPEGTIVTLGIERAGNEDLIEIPIERAEIIIKSVRGWTLTPKGEWDFYIDRDRRIGYVRISQFIPQTDTDLTEAINRMQRDNGLHALILDLRWNPGGLLSSAIEVSDRFIESGPIVYTEGPRGHRTSTPRAKRHGTYPSMPMVILINHASASASEIVAGAVQDHGRDRNRWIKPVVIGTRTFGKGSVQDLFPLSGRKAFLKLTTQYYKLPLGRIIHRTPEATEWGIQPDLVVKMTAKQIADSLELRQELDVLRVNGDPFDANDPDRAPRRPQDIIDQGADPQLEAGLLVLKSRLVAQRLVQSQAVRAMANVP